MEGQESISAGNVKPGRSVRVLQWSLGLRKAFYFLCQGQELNRQGPRRAFRPPMIEMLATLGIIFRSTHNSLTQ